MQSQVTSYGIKEVAIESQTFVARDVGVYHNKIKGMLVLQNQSEATNESNEYILDHSTFMNEIHKNLRTCLRDHDQVKNG